MTHVRVGRLSGGGGGSHRWSYHGRLHIGGAVAEGEGKSEEGEALNYGFHGNRCFLIPGKLIQGDAYFLSRKHTLSLFFKHKTFIVNVLCLFWIPNRRCWENLNRVLCIPNRNLEL